MTIEEFKALPIGTRIVWKDTQVVGSGVITCSSSHIQVAWDNGAVDRILIRELTASWCSFIELEEKGQGPSVRVTIPYPDGFTSKGEWRVPSVGDYYLCANGSEVIQQGCGVCPNGPRLILYPIKPKTIYTALEEYVNRLDSLDAEPIADEIRKIIKAYPEKTD